jgi:HPt (histidine-containing phosphotransfer) domain-containing protein
VTTEKQSFSGLNGEIITCALGQEARFNHLKIEHFDPESLWVRLDGDVELFCELTELFIAEAPRMLAQIEKAIRDNSAPALEKASHKIKGSLLQFSARGAAAIALELEQNGRLGLTRGADVLLKQLAHEIDLMQKTLHAMVNREAGKFQE